MSVVTIENLSKIYPPTFPRLKKFLHLEVKPTVEALKNVSFEIQAGEIFGLIGRNGAGKTTLTKIIATLIQPDAGRVTVSGFDSILDEVKVRSLIGLATAEERSFYWRLTAEQNLLFFARLYGMKDADARRRIAEIFQQLNLNELKSRRFSELSTGNKQRLAIARAILPEPPILLLDEPTRSLDPLAAESMRELILSFKDISILLTSHNLSEVEVLCRRVAVISKGEIRAINTPENLRRAHRQTQSVKIFFSRAGDIQFEDFAPLNLSDSELEIDADKYVLKFTRETSDALLGETIAFLTAKSAKILDVETEQATLLDVLENYDEI